jgi:hypothetical protein
LLSRLIALNRSANGGHCSRPLIISTASRAPVIGFPPSPEGKAFPKADLTPAQLGTSGPAPTEMGEIRPEDSQNQLQKADQQPK